MGDLPLIPGYSFDDCFARDHKIKQKLTYSNGCRIVCDSNIGIGRRPVDSASSAYLQELPEPAVYDPTLTYGRRKGFPYRQVIPHYVLYAQKCLKFNAFFRESVSNSPSEYHRVRHVNIIYFLEDDTISIIEPPVDNAGLKQGKLVSRARIPMNEEGKFYHWKDLNVGINLAIYGIVYHTVDCDEFTREFLLSQGIDVNEKEDLPLDSYIQNRTAKATAAQMALAASKRSHSGSYDKRRRFLEFTGMVLTFEAIWNDDFYYVMYFLMDDTMSVKEVSNSIGGKDPHSILLKRMKVPKNWTNMPNTFPSIYLECGDEEIVEYYAPVDLVVGKTIFIFGRRFLLYDCNGFTRKYYSKMLNIEQPARCLPPDVIPPSRRSTCNQPRPRTSLEKYDDKKKETVIRNVFHHPMKLRYLMSMIAIHPEDEGRNFILEFNLSDGKMRINEIGKPNSGHRGGCFLSLMHVPKSKKPVDVVGTNDDNEITYYTPEDFFIGAQINIFSHRFTIIKADHFVLRYLQDNPDKFSSGLIENISNYFNEEIRKNEERATVEQQDECSKMIMEPILPAQSCIDESNNLQEVVSQVLPQTIPNFNEMAKNERVTTPRQITWADQVEIPCRS